MVMDMSTNPLEHANITGVCDILSTSEWLHRYSIYYISYPIGSMYAIYGNIYHPYTPNVSIYTIHGSYGYMYVIYVYSTTIRHNPISHLFSVRLDWPSSSQQLAALPRPSANALPFHRHWSQHCMWSPHWDNGVPGDPWGLGGWAGDGNHEIMDWNNGSYQNLRVINPLYMILWTIYKM